ncbi:NAD(P)-binding protein [Rhodohalobacter sulfatireducens]|uniref:NAD(P)-binding protein n=1 Tax=Rhodohalobacter sulfatireducens TaxID=2911366 RepID=UPI003F716DB9
MRVQRKVKSKSKKESNRNRCRDYGLYCACELMKLGHEVVVLEASGRYGGTALSVHDGSWALSYHEYFAWNFKPNVREYENLYSINNSGITTECCLHNRTRANY